MVVGLDRFKTHFADYSDQYVLIGGAACAVAMDQAGLSFRATKDLDIVLCVEALDAGFGTAFWAFIREGSYATQETSTGRRQFYRFQRPSDETYPFMLELFARTPDILPHAPGSHLTPIPFDEEVSSLSAILMNDDYYAFLQVGKRVVDGLRVAGAETLIPLKARAWLDLGNRKLTGDRIDSKEIKKHKNDVFRLAGIVDRDLVGQVPQVVKNDLSEFLSKAKAEGVDLKALGIRNLSLEQVASELRSVYGLD